MRVRDVSLIMAGKPLKTVAQLIPAWVGGACFLPISLFHNDLISSGFNEVHVMKEEVFLFRRKSISTTLTASRTS